MGNKKVIVIGAGPSGKTPWYKEKEMMFHKAIRGSYIGNNGIFEQLDKSVEKRIVPPDTPWYENIETDKDNFVVTDGLFAQFEKAAAESPTPYRDVTLKDIEKFWNEAQSDLEKKDVFDPFDNPYLTLQNKKDINKAMVECQESQEYNFGKIRRSGFNNPKFSKTPTIGVPDSKSKYHK